MCTEYVEAPQQSFLLIIIGPPGAGKTELAYEVKKFVPSCLVVSKDENARRIYNAWGRPENEADYLNRYRGPIYTQVGLEMDYLLRFGPVVADLTQRLEREKEDWYYPYKAIAHAHGVPMVCVELKPPPETLFQRLDERPTQPDFYDTSTEEGRLRYIKDWLTNPSKLPADCSLIIDSSRPIQEVARETLAFIERKLPRSLLQVRHMLNYT